MIKRQKIVKKKDLFPPFQVSASHPKTHIKKKEEKDTKEKKSETKCTSEVNQKMMILLPAIVVNMLRTQVKPKIKFFRRIWKSSSLGWISMG